MTRRAAAAGTCCCFPPSHVLVINLTVQAITIHVTQAYTTPVATQGRYDSPNPPQPPPFHRFGLTSAVVLTARDRPDSDPTTSPRSSRGRTGSEHTPSYRLRTRGPAQC